MSLSLLRTSILGRFRAQTLTLNRRLISLSSASAASSDQILSSNPADDLRPVLPNSIENSVEINSLVSYLTARVEEYVTVGSPALPLLFGAEVHLNTQPWFADSSEATRIKVMSMVANIIQSLPEVNKVQTYHAKIFYRSMLRDDSKDDLTKDDIISKVLSVTQDYPNIGDYEVTEESHFLKDLGFNKWDCFEVNQALQVEFKLDIPDEIVSCKLAIDYIYSHRMERLSPEEFRKHIFLTGDYGESKSEFRRIYVRDEEMRANYIESDSSPGRLHCEMLTWNDILLFQLFSKLDGQFFFNEHY